MSLARIVRGSFTVWADTADEAAAKAEPLVHAVAGVGPLRWGLSGVGFQPTVTGEILSTEWTVEWERVNR